jgi:hypothetical protein
MCFSQYVTNPDGNRNQVYQYIAIGASILKNLINNLIWEKLSLKLITIL